MEGKTTNIRPHAGVYSDGKGILTLTGYSVSQSLTSQRRREMGRRYKLFST